MNGKSGRAVFEANGKTSWEWQTSTGVFEQHISEEQMRQVAPIELELVEHKKPERRKYEGLWVHDSN
jgi:hypothetical protein